MSQQFHNASAGDTITVPDALIEKYEADPRWEAVEKSTAADGESVLKGAALDDALDAAGLPKTGSADEKRARLAEHEENI